MYRAEGNAAKRILNRHAKILRHSVVPSLLIPGLQVGTLRTIEEYEQFLRTIMLFAFGVCRPDSTAEEREEMWQRYVTLDCGGFYEGVPQHAILHAIGWMRDNVGRVEETYAPYVLTRGLINGEERDVALCVITRITKATKHGEYELKRRAIVRSASRAFVEGRVKTWAALMSFPGLLVPTTRDGVEHAVPLLPFGKIAKIVKETTNASYIPLQADETLFRATAFPLLSLAVPSARGRPTNPPCAHSMVTPLLLPSTRYIRDATSKLDALVKATRAPAAPPARPARARAPEPSSPSPPPRPPSPPARTRQAARRPPREPSPPPAPEPEPEWAPPDEPAARTPPASPEPPRPRRRRAAAAGPAPKRARPEVRVGRRTAGPLLGYMQDRYAEAAGAAFPTGELAAFLERAAPLPAAGVLAEAAAAFGRWADVVLAWLAYVWPATRELADGPLHLGYAAPPSPAGRAPPARLEEVVTTLWGDYEDGRASDRRCAAAAFDRMGVAEFGQLCADGFGPYALAVCYPHTQPAGDINW